MNISTEAKVGAVALTGLILLVYMIIHLGNFTFGERGYPLKAVFAQVNGLREGNAVRYAGVEVGKVTAVDALTNGVKVSLIINSGVSIPEGSRFSIGADGLLGEKFVNITPPPQSNGMLKPNDVVQGEAPQGLEELIASATQVLGDVRVLVRSLNGIMGDEKVKTAMKESIVNARDITANLAALTATLDRMAQNNEGNVNTMVANLRAVSDSLRQISGRVDSMVAGVDHNGQTARDLRETIENLKNTSARVEKMAASIENVVTDPETAENVREILRNARAASEKANQMLSKVSNISTKTGYEFRYNKNTGKYSSSADVRINTSPQDFALMGVNNFGDSTTGNLQIGKENGGFTTRAGIIDSQVGVGVDAQINKQMQMSFDAYDPNDIRFNVSTKYRIAPDTFIVGEEDSINKSTERNTFWGVRKEF
jgi:phospholipid/cholesterol/gamma-HCH transport system substrate-binding protein